MKKKNLILLNGNELDELIEQAKKDNLPIFNSQGFISEEILRKWKPIFGFDHSDSK